jgi:hypothetical protein
MCYSYTELLSFVDDPTQRWIQAERLNFIEECFRTKAMD